MEFEWDETKRRTNIRDHKVDFVDAPSFLMAARRSPTTRHAMMKTAGVLSA